MIPQNKGKDLHKIAKSKLVDRDYYKSIKYDGHYVQIHYDYPTKEVKFYTSGGKEFHLMNMAATIITHISESFIVECEYSYGSIGRLGDRGKSAMLTTYRTNFEKGIATTGSVGVDIFRPFDLLDMPNTPFSERLNRLMVLFYELNVWFKVPIQELIPNLAKATEEMNRVHNLGFEGVMLKSPDHIYQPGKRTNDIIKMKPRLTADLRCVAWKEGTGKYVGMIGSLLLEDDDGIQVWVGSGLNDGQRCLDAERHFIDKTIEIEYESFKDTYIQPIYKFIRKDK